MAVPAEDAQGLAEAVLKIYKMDASGRKVLGDNGRKYYEKHFDREKLLDKLDEWLSEVKRNDCRRTRLIQDGPHGVLPAAHRPDLHRATGIHL